MFGLFKKKKKKDIPDIPDNSAKHKYYDYNQVITYSTIPPSKIYEVNEKEELFFDTLLDKSANLKGMYQLERLADGTINVSYKGYPIGKVRLQCRKHFILYFTNLYDVQHVYDDFDAILNAIDYWIIYIKRYLRYE